jgi:hypothetical protein
VQAIIVIGRSGLETATARARIPRGLLLAAAAGLILVASLAAGSGPLIDSRRSIPQSAPSRYPAPSVIPGTSPGVVPGQGSPGVSAGSAKAGASAGGRAAIVIAAVVAGIALVTLLSLAVKSLIKFISDLDALPLGPKLEANSTPLEAEPEQIQRKLRDQIAVALEDLERGGDPRGAIMACWLRLEAAVAAGGIERHPTETSGELVRKVLDRLQIATTPLDRLHELYLRARFSSASIGIVERDAARDALERLRLGVFPDSSHAQGSSGEMR